MKYQSKPQTVEAIRASKVIDYLKATPEDRAEMELPFWVTSVIAGTDQRCFGFLLREDRLVLVRQDGLSGGPATDYVFYTKDTGVMIANQKAFDEMYDLVH